MEIVDRYLKPNFFQENNQAEFRIPKNKIYSNSIYLEQLGFTAATADGVLYNKLTGALGCIKSAVLLDNGVEIDSCKNCGGLTGFKNKLGLPKRVVNKVNHETSSRTGQILRSGVATNKTITSQIVGSFDTQLLGPDASTGHDGLVNLSFFFPILNQLPSVDTNLFTDLRVRLEFTSDKFDLFSAQDKPTSQMIPVMRLQEIEDPKIAASMAIKSGNVPWLAYEHDRYVIPANAGTNTGFEQTTSVRLNGIRNKSIGRVLIQKGYVTTSEEKTGNDYGNFASRSLFKEKIQVRVNGANLFAEGGLGGDTCMDIMAVCADAWGDYTLNPYEGEHSCGVGDFDANPANLEISTYVDNVRLNKGAYIGFHVQGKANDFFIEHKRTCVTGDVNSKVYNSAGSASLDALSCNVYFEVKKNLMVKNGKYIVQYM
jgi:hypothetical protein